MFALLIVLVTAGALAASFALVPHSVRLYMASIATCQDLEAALRSSPDPQFNGVRFWERPLAKVYRFKYWHHGGPTTVSNRAAGSLSVFSVFVTASDATDGNCDTAILGLIERYLNASGSLDGYDSLGYTALHSAVIFQKAEFVRILLSGGADRSLIARSDNELAQNKSAVEIAIWFREKKNDDVSVQIANMLLEAD